MHVLRAHQLKTPFVVFFMYVLYRSSAPLARSLRVLSSVFVSVSALAITGTMFT